MPLLQLELQGIMGNNSNRDTMEKLVPTSPTSESLALNEVAQLCGQVGPAVAWLAGHLTTRLPA